MTQTPNTPSVAPAATTNRGRAAPPILRLAAVVFFFLPLALCLVGLQSKPIENRPPAPFPHLRLSWSVVNELSVYVTDRLPFRDRAVRLNAQVSQNVFHEAPSTGQRDTSAVGGVVAPRTGGQTSAPPLAGEAPEPAPAQEKGFISLPSPGPEKQQQSSAAVIVGQHGWLYLGSEFSKECYRGQPPTQVVAGLTRLQHVLASSGRRFVFTLAPDKSTAEAGMLPSSYPHRTCVAASKQQTYGLLDQARIPGYVNMRGLIAQHEKQENRSYYFRKDTHWNGLADALLAERVASLLDPNLLGAVRKNEHLVAYTGDLTQLLGDPQTDQSIGVDVLRAGVRSTSPTSTPLTSGVTGFRTTASTSGVALVPGLSLLIGDSFSEAAEPALRPFFADLLRVRNGDFARAPRTMLAQVKAAQTVVLVWNERYFSDANYGVLWSMPFLDKLEAALKQP